MRKIWRAVHGANWPVRVANPAIKADFARRIKLVERFRIIQEGSSKPARTSKGDHWRRVTSGGFPFVFEIVDKAAAAFPLELRHPLFDHKLVEFCVALPPDQKLCSGWTRIVMRRALADALPEEIRWRSGKTYLGTNFSQGLLRFEKPLLEAFVLNPPKIIDEYLDAATLRRIYHRYSFKKTEQDALTVWKAVTLGRWLQQTELTP
jgi:asparagine synthase (glutamine-hydrolysing)